MTLDSYRPHVARFFPPFVALAQRLHLTPNALTILSFFAAGGAGVAFYAGSLAVGVVMVALNAVFDALDGAVARAGNLQSKKGDFLDHAIDRYADISWPQARTRLRRLAADGKIDLVKVANVAAHERGAGLRERITDLVEA